MVNKDPDELKRFHERESNWGKVARREMFNMQKGMVSGVQGEKPEFSVRDSVGSVQTGTFEISYSTGIDSSYTGSNPIRSCTPGDANCKMMVINADVGSNGIVSVQNVHPEIRVTVDNVLKHTQRNRYMSFRLRVWAIGVWEDEKLHVILDDGGHNKERVMTTLVRESERGCDGSWRTYHGSVWHMGAASLSGIVCYSDVFFRAYVTGTKSGNKLDLVLRSTALDANNALNEYFGISHAIITHDIFDDSETIELSGEKTSFSKVISVDGKDEPLVCPGDTCGEDFKSCKDKDDCGTGAACATGFPGNHYTASTLGFCEDPINCIYRTSGSTHGVVVPEMAILW